MHTNLKEQNSFYVFFFFFFRQGTLAMPVISQTNGEFWFLRRHGCCIQDDCLYHLSFINTMFVSVCLSDFAEIVPVRILSQQKSISENSNLYVTCSTFGFKKNQQKVFVYLCKDGLGILKLVQKQDQHDTTFTMYNVGRNYSGNYSCAYSRAEYKPSEVATKGHNIIQILVIGKYFHFYKSIMSVFFLSVHFLLLPCSQFSPCRYFSSWPIYCQRGRQCRIQVYCLWHPANTRQMSAHPVLPEEEWDCPPSASV